MSLSVHTRKHKVANAIAMVFGDGHIHHKYLYLSCRHSAAQAEYARYKAELVSGMQATPVVVREIDNSGFPGVEFQSRKRPLFRILRQKIYDSRRVKRYHRYLLDKLTPEAIAIWYQDQGSLVAKKRKNGKVHAYELYMDVYNDLDTIIGYFSSTWGIVFSKVKSKGRTRLRMGTREARKFVKLVEPFVVSCLRYKVDPLLV